MLQYPKPDLASDTWENEGGSIPSLSDVRHPGAARFLNKTYVVGGNTYTNLADAMVRVSHRHKKSPVS